MGSQDLIVKQIEILREQMTEMATHKGFTSKESIEISQKLDNLLNHYYRLQRNSNEKQLEF